MKTLFYLLLGAVSAGALLLANQEAVRVPSDAAIVRQQGGAACYYPNSITCDHALPEQLCAPFCRWHDVLDPLLNEEDPDDPLWLLWGFHGRWECDGNSEEVLVNTLTTVIKSSETSLGDGWPTKEETDDPQDCNTVRTCNCWPAHAPRDPAWGLELQQNSFCRSQQPDLDSPTVILERTTGDQNCRPGPNG